MVSNGHTKSCGCQSKLKRYLGSPLIPNKKYGKITAVKMAGKSGHNMKWECKCECGKSFTALASNIASGNTKSCGCHRRKVSTEMLRTHGMSGTNSYRLWSNMMRRCRDEGNAAYANYGGRGIKVCDRWLEFENFFSDMGDRPKDRSLERRDNDLGYSPGNCYWATRKQQMNNTRANVILTIGDTSKTMTQWCEEFLIPVHRVIARRKMGWKDDELFLPKRAKR